MAAAGDQFEIQSSQIALVKSSSADVRNYAQMLINDHTLLDSQVIAAATASGLAAPIPVFSPDQQQMLNDLQAANAGSSFDMLFLRDQIMAHEMALALHSNYASAGDTPALRAVAANAVPSIQMHLNTAEQLMVSMGGMMASAFCPANYWCNSDFDAYGQSFSVCCPSDVPLLPPVSVAASVYATPVTTTYASAPVATTTYATATYASTPLYASAPASTTIYASGSAVPAGYIRAFGTVVPAVRVASNTVGGLYGNVPVGTQSATIYSSSPVYSSSPLYTTVG
jgi:putative membrane protein